MADSRLNSIHLEPERRQEFRRAREVLLRDHDPHTYPISPSEDASSMGHTIIQKGNSAAAKDLTFWLADGKFLYPLQIGVNTLGRSTENDVVVEDAYVSRRHCAILVHSTETAELHDTASKNGTYLNGNRLTGPSILKCGDEIRISERQYIYFTRNGKDESDSPSATLME